MKHHKLRELAKFGAGLIVGDFLALCWLAYTGAFPVEFFGRTLTDAIILPALVFDAALFIILVHYGWHIGKIPVMRERTYLLIAGTVFAIVSLAHLLRIFTEGDLSVFGLDVPMWLSWIGMAVTALLAYTSFHFALRDA